MYGALDISVSGIAAQRARLEVVSANVAKIDSPVDPAKDPDQFRRQFAALAPRTVRGQDGKERVVGVEVTEIGLDQSPFRKVYDPDNPFAAKVTDESKDQVAGYVNYPDIHWPTEMMNAYDATRLYEANIVVAEATKTMMAQALQLIA
ncbi:MAG: hypothetical protein H6814_08450 [Phycisphaeraceae bacterium]|nr:hypothetical protein [Phycisphaeraceae bacterium]